MRRFLPAVLLVIVLAGCARSTRVETIDGRECMVHRNAFGRITALSCNMNETP